MAAELRIVRQTSLATEKFTKDGKPATVHVLLKDKPFLVEVGRTNGSVDLRAAVLEANLFYDSPCKEVEWIKVQPFEYTAKVNADGSVATLESYIHILSSQNENALFRLRIRALFPAGGKKNKNAGATPAEPLEVFSEPIQVISKPSVLRRKHEREHAKHETLVQQATATATPINAPASTKRSRDDVILETLAEIKRAQEQQQRLLETLAATGSPSSPPTSPLAGASSSYSSSPASSAHSTPLVEPEESFESIFSNCIRAYNNLERDSRGGKVRKVLRELGSQGVAFAEAVWSESFQREIDAQVGRMALLESAPAVPAAASGASWRENSSTWRLASSEAAAAAADPDFADVLLPVGESAMTTN